MPLDEKTTVAPAHRVGDAVDIHVTGVTVTGLHPWRRDGVFAGHVLIGEYGHGNGHSNVVAVNLSDSAVKVESASGVLPVAAGETLVSADGSRVFFAIHSNTGGVVLIDPYNKAHDPADANDKFGPLTRQTTG